MKSINTTRPDHGEDGGSRIIKSIKVMKTNTDTILPNQNQHGLSRRISKFGMAAAQAVLIGFGAAIATGQAVDSEVDDQGAEVLTRGPVHEAFAGIVSYNPEPGIIVDTAPPELIEELTPESRPSGDNISWIPGYWAWDDERTDYLWVSGTWRALPPGRQWTTGYWAEGRSDWDWIPANYVWTPRGYVFVDGYWDYSFNRRGVLYAPVYFQSGYRSRPGYSYSPVVAIGLVAMMEHLFLRPRNHHYYFGDYYDRRYRDTGYYSPYAYQSSRYGHDPVYSYRRWTHRQDRDWERRYEASYDYRRDHESARPPRTWADQKRLRMDTAEAREQQLMMATPFEQLAKRKDSPMRIERVAEKEREKISNMNREVRKTRDQRRTLETEGVNISRDQVEREFKPTKAKLAASPIVGRSPDGFDKKQAPPKQQRSPIDDPEKERSDRQPDAEKPRPERGTQAQPERRADKQTRPEPQAKEPKREPRQPKEATKPPSRKKSETDEEEAKPPFGKAQNK